MSWRYVLVPTPRQRRSGVLLPLHERSLLQLWLDSAQPATGNCPNAYVIGLVFPPERKRLALRLFFFKYKTLWFLGFIVHPYVSNRNLRSFKLLCITSFLRGSEHLRKGRVSCWGWRVSEARCEPLRIREPSQGTWNSWLPRKSLVGGGTALASSAWILFRTLVPNRF